MTLVEKLTAVAIWLSREVGRHHEQKRIYELFDFVERNGSIRREVWSADMSAYGPGGEVFCRGSAYHRKPWVLLTFNPAKPGSTGSVSVPQPEVPVIVYFQPRPAMEAKDQTERRGKTKAWRGALRKPQPEGSLWSSNIMVIGRETSEDHIIEQIAIFLMRRGISDSSTEKALGFGSSNRIKAAMAPLLVQNFIDPEHSLSYPAYKKCLRLRVVGPDEAFSDSAIGVDDQLCDDRSLSDEDRRKMRVSVRRHSPGEKSYSVGVASNVLGIPRRTLYFRISKDQISTIRARFERIRIPAAKVERLRQERQRNGKEPRAFRFIDKEARHLLVHRIAEKRGVKPASARRYINRALKKDKTLPEIVLEARLDLEALKSNSTD